jgi:small subunit ribosomal protein S6
MRIYELIFILKPGMPDEAIDAIVEQFSGIITEGGGIINKIDRWGQRRLAYKERGQRDGYYVLIDYSVESNSGLSKEIERRLRVVDDVIKYLTVRVDEARKRAEKLKAKRDKRNSRKPAPSEGRGSSSAPSAPQRPVPAAPPEGE